MTEPHRKSSMLGAELDYNAISKLPFRPCSRHGCLNRGVWGLKLCVPATGFRLFQHQPMTCLVNVVVCDTHIEGVRSEDFVSVEIQNYMVDFAKKAKKVEPDFRRAYMDGVPVNEREWLLFVAEADKVKR